MATDRILWVKLGFGRKDFSIISIINQWEEQSNGKRVVSKEPSVARRTQIQILEGIYFSGIRGAVFLIGMGRPHYDMGEISFRSNIFSVP